MLRILLGGCDIKDDRRITIHFTSNEEYNADFLWTLNYFNKYIDTYTTRNIESTW